MPRVQKDPSGGSNFQTAYPCLSCPHFAVVEFSRSKFRNMCGRSGAWLDSAGKGETMTMPPSLLSVPAQGYALSVSSAFFSSYSCVVFIPSASAIFPRVERRHSVIPSSVRAVKTVCFDRFACSAIVRTVTFFSSINFFMLLINTGINVLLFVPVHLTILYQYSIPYLTKEQHEDSPEGSGNFQTGPNHQLTAEV